MAADTRGFPDETERIAIIAETFCCAQQSDINEIAQHLCTLPYSFSLSSTYVTVASSSTPAKK